MAKHQDEEDPPPRVLAVNLILAEKASEAAGQIIARAALLELILSDPRWQDTFADWLVELGMFPVARELREALDAAAAQAAERRLSEVFDALGRTRALEEKVETFVESTLRLTYSWLPQDLHLGFQQAVLAYVYKEDRQTVFDLTFVQMPRLRVRAFQNRPNETLAELKARWRALNVEVEQTFRELERAVLAGDRMPKAGGEYIAKCVRWFYSVHTRLTNVTVLAKEEHRARHPHACTCDARDGRSAIRAGIRKAQTLLAVDVLDLEIRGRPRALTPGLAPVRELEQG